jgi:hypothetical protein
VLNAGHLVVEIEESVHFGSDMEGRVSTCYSCCVPPPLHGVTLNSLISRKVRLKQPLNMVLNVRKEISDFHCQFSIDESNSWFVAVPNNLILFLHLETSEEYGNFLDT